MTYVDAFVIPIPKRNLLMYRQLARKSGKIWREHGALQFRECVGDDLNPAGIKLPFPRLARLKPGETVLFSWIVYKSRAHRDRVNKRVMKDARIEKMMTDSKSMPFDLRRMTYGGFRMLVDA